MMDKWTGRGDMGRLSFSSECSSEDDGAGPGPPAKRRLSPGPPAKRQRTDMPAGSPAKRQRTDMPAVIAGGTLTDSEDEDLNHQPSFGSLDPGQRQLAPGDFIAKVDPGHTKGAGYSNFAEKMMAKMGFEKGKGLGRHGQGRRDIIEASKQKGRRGLGMVVPMFEPADVQWKFELEEVTAKEKVDWLPVCELPPLDMEEMRDWMIVDKVKLDISDETEFCSQQTVTTVLSCKSVFDNLEGEQMRRARTRSNPYETIKGVFFQNRAAMKMANMDAIMDFMFTEPKTMEGEPAVGPDELLYFADVCAGPGGFSEYVLWRKKWDSKGFGFTLRGENDFKLHEFFSASSELFEPHYGVDATKGDGDVFRPDNQEAFQKFVMESTNGKGVHFVMADGGFSVEGQENIQEILSKRLYLCQFLVALSILREGGHFVCKLFDVFTPFSVGLVYLMYRAFHQVSIFKPVTSRPANSERYIVCKWKRYDSQSILEYMRLINECLDENTKRRTGDDVQDVVPLDMLQQDETFFNYIVTSNEMLGKKQAIALSKIQTFAQNSDLYENRQAEMRRECLRIWKVPDEVRKAPPRNIRADVKFNELVKDRRSLTVTPKVLNMMNLSESIRSVYDYRCVVSGSTERCYLLSLGRTNVYQWDGHSNHNWRKVIDRNLEIPADTLLEVEFVEEFKGQGSGQQKQRTVHVIDGWMLGGQDISNLHFMLRMQKISKFVRAISRPTRYDLSTIHTKELHKCEDISSLFSEDSLQVRLMKGSSRQQRVCYNRTPGQYFVPTGVYFIKTVRDPWMMAVSSKGPKYFFNTMNRDSTHQTPSDSIASFGDCVKSRLLWKWEDGVKIHPAQQNDSPDKISAVRIQEFVYKHTKRH